MRRLLLPPRPLTLRRCLSSSLHDKTFLKDVGWWNEFYAKKGREEKFDWFEPDVDLCFRLIAQGLASTATPPAEQRILHLGCGTSAWCELLEEAFPEAAEVVHLDAASAAVSALELADVTKGSMLASLFTTYTRVPGPWKSVHRI